MSASSKKNLVQWIKNRTQDYENVDIKNLHTSWNSGLGFCALVHSIDSSALDFKNLDPNNVEQNLKIAFDAAEEKLGIEKLLDPEDILDEDVPDTMIVYMYLVEFYKKYGANKADAEAKKEEPEDTVDFEGEGDEIVNVDAVMKEAQKLKEKKERERKEKKEREEKKKREDVQANTEPAQPAADTPKDTVQEAAPEKPTSVKDAESGKQNAPQEGTGTCCIIL